jgi:uncharacterized protein with HEPN domain
MPDPIVLERLQLILEHGAVIEERVRHASDEEMFFERQDATLIIDSLITRLQALSENIKKIQKLEPSFFKENVSLDTTPIIRFRDLASHHYELLDHAAVLQICKTKVPLVVNAVQTYLGNQGAG